LVKFCHFSGLCIGPYPAYVWTQEEFKQQKGIRKMANQEWLNRKIKNSHDVQLWQLLVATALGLFTLMCMAQGFQSIRAYGATFNTIFNNVEQGPGSTSNPVLNVTNGKPTTPATSASTQSSSHSSSPVDLGSQVELAPQVASSELPQTTIANGELPFRRFRLNVSGTVMKALHESTHPENKFTGGSLGLSYFLDKDVGFRAIVGGQEGRRSPLLMGEFEFLPLRASLFRMEDFMELGVIFGLTNYVPLKDTWGSAYAGVRSNLNLGQRWGVSAALRSNFTQNKENRFVQGELGFLVRL
jgi:hypothetical protein